MILIYDNSFEGFLSLVYDVFYQKLKPLKIHKELPNEMLFEEIHFIKTNEEKYTKVLKGYQIKFFKTEYRKNTKYIYV